jgi:hypothetical protein
VTRSIAIKFGLRAYLIIIIIIKIMWTKRVKTVYMSLWIISGA